MNRDNVVSQVIDTVKRIQESSGRTAVGIGPDTRPFRDVEGFDSLSAIEATIILSEVLGQELPDSVFVPSEGNRILSVKEIAENACSHISTGGTNR